MFTSSDHRKQYLLLKIITTYLKNIFHQYNVIDPTLISHYLTQIRHMISNLANFRPAINLKGCSHEENREENIKPIPFVA
mgnify:CR=1 FL=1